MERQYICDSLYKWLQTFDVETEFDSITSLGDGVIMSEVLMQIAPGFFNEEWKSKIKVDVEVSNKRIKISNLKKILKGIFDYYSQVLGQQIIDFPMPDVSLIGEFGDSMELGKLLQLILGCAVNCQNKEEYIQYIMGMDEDVQQYIMKAIQELMNKEVPAPPGASETGDTQNQLKETWQALQEAVQAKEELLLRCGELDVQLASIQEEKIGLTAENQRLQEKIHMSEQLLDEDSGGSSSTAAERKYQHLQAKVDNFQDELYRLENVCQDQRIKLELQEKEILDVQLKNESLVKLADEARSLKDEVDILRHNSEKALQYELSIDTYKKKLEEMGDVKRQLKLLEEKNTNYVQSSMEMEEELRKAQSFRTQVERYKKEIHELHAKLSEESKRADRLDFDNKRHHEKLLSLQRENERLVTMRDSLSETNEELRMMLLQSGAERKQSLLENSPDDSTIAHMLELVPPEIKEKLIRLQHENKLLKLSADGSTDDNSRMLQSMLDDANVRINELQSASRLSNQKVMELESQIEDLQENARKAGSASLGGANKSTQEQVDRMRMVEEELARKAMVADELERNLQISNERATRLSETLQLREQTMKAQEEKYKKYLEKARNVIRMLDPKQNPGTSPEVETLRQQLVEKDRLIQLLEKEHEKSRLTRDQEEKLIVSAWYNLGMQLHRKAVDERLSNQSAGQSFLARQRQITSRRSNTFSGNHTPR